MFSASTFRNLLLPWNDTCSLVLSTIVMKWKAKFPIMNGVLKCSRKSSVKVWNIWEFALCNAQYASILFCNKFFLVIKGYFSPHHNESNYTIERLEFLLREALDEDEDDNVEEASALYMEAVETGLKVVSCSCEFVNNFGLIASFAEKPDYRWSA